MFKFLDKIQFFDRQLSFIALYILPALPAKTGIQRAFLKYDSVNTAN